MGKKCTVAFDGKEVLGRRLSVTPCSGRDGTEARQDGAWWKLEYRGAVADDAQAQKLDFVIK